MVDLEDLPQLKAQTPRDNSQAKRQAEAYRRVPVEQAPRGERERDKLAPLPDMRPTRRQGPLPPSVSRQVPERAEKPGKGLFKREEPRMPDLARLYPSADRMEQLEESYRRKYEAEVKESDAKFLNTDDIMFGSFLRRFETSVYNVWRYPPEAAKLGIEGVVPVKITFNRQGEISKVEVLESSGSKILDDEVRRTLRLIGPVGSLPRGYDKESFNLIAFFHYGIISGTIRGRLY